MEKHKKWGLDLEAQVGQWVITDKVLVLYYTYMPTSNSRYTKLVAPQMYYKMVPTYTSLRLRTHLNTIQVYNSDISNTYGLFLFYAFLSFYFDSTPTIQEFTQLKLYWIIKI